MSDAAAWVQDRAHIAAAGVGNLAAWMNGMDTGAAITTLTAVVGLGAYAIKTIGNAITEVRVNRDKQMADTLSGQMERLNQNLESARALADSQAKLAETAGRRADQADAHVVELTAEVGRLTAEVARASGRVEDANRKLHEMARVAQRDSLRAELAERELAGLKSTLGQVNDTVRSNQVQITSANSRLSHVGERLGQAAELLAGSSDGETPGGPTDAGPPP